MKDYFELIDLVKWYNKKPCDYYTNKLFEISDNLIQNYSEIKNNKTTNNCKNQLQKSIAIAKK